MFFLAVLTAHTQSLEPDQRKPPIDSPSTSAVTREAASSPHTAVTERLEATASVGNGR
jgi:hypothetical protein